MPDQFTQLPPLNHVQVKAVTGYLSAYGTLIEAATKVGMDLGTFLEQLATPEVQTHLKHAKRIARDRADQYLAESAYAATHTLRMIAEDVDADKTERRRAASTILRGLGVNQQPRHRRPDFKSLNRIIKQLVGVTPSVKLEDSFDTSPARAREEADPNPSHPPPLPPSLRAGRAGEGSVSPPSDPSPHSDGESLGEGLPNLQRSNATSPNGITQRPSESETPAESPPPPLPPSPHAGRAGEGSGSSISTLQRSNTTNPNSVNQHQSPALNPKPNPPSAKPPRPLPCSPARPPPS